MRPFQSIFAIFLCGIPTGYCLDPLLLRGKRQSGARQARDGDMIEDLLDPVNYHKYIRPGIDSDEPLQVNVSIDVTNLDKISDVDMEYTITFTLYQSWVDERLRGFFKLKKPLTMDGSLSDRLWVPDTYMVNAQTSFIHSVTTRNGLVIMHPNQVIVYVLRITSRVSCPMKLHKYPMDEQVCKLKLASWSFAHKNVIYNWDKGDFCGENGSVTGVMDVVLPQFNITKCKIYTELKPRLLGDQSHQLVLAFGLKRNILFFIMQTYFPSVLLVILSWISFWINMSSVPARVSLGATTVLSMTTLMIGVYGNGPKSTSYIKAIDCYVFVCYGFIFMALLEYAGAHYVLRHCSEKAKRLAKKRSSDVQVKAHNGDNGRDWYSPSGKSSNESFEVSLFSSPESQSIKCEDKSRMFFGEEESEFKKFLSRQTGDQVSENDVFTAKLAKLNAIQTKVERIDTYSRAGFPFLFIVFNTAYWWVYLNMEE